MMKNKSKRRFRRQMEQAKKTGFARAFKWFKRNFKKKRNLIVDDE